MDTPTFTARKTGDHYELEPRHEASQAVARGSAGSIPSWMPWIGGGLIVLGLARRGLFGAALCTAGGAMLYRAVTENQAAGEQSGPADNPIERLKSSASPTYQNEGDRTDQLPQDRVEEESMESFPASDAPSASVSRTS